MTALPRSRPRFHLRARHNVSQVRTMFCLGPSSFHPTENLSPLNWLRLPWPLPCSLYSLVPRPWSRPWNVPARSLSQHERSTRRSLCPKCSSSPRGRGGLLPSSSWLRRPLLRRIFPVYSIQSSQHVANSITSAGPGALQKLLSPLKISPVDAPSCCPSIHSAANPMSREGPCFADT